MDIDTNVDVLSVIFPKIKSYKTTLINFAKSRFLVAAQEFGMNDKESAALTEIADSIDVAVSKNGKSVIFEFTYGTNKYLNIIQNGMPAPLLGGDGGIAENPDGSTYHSKVNPNLWGNTINSFAKEGKDVIGEVELMATTFAKDVFEDAISDSEEELEILFIPKVEEAIGGVS